MPLQLASVNTNTPHGTLQNTNLENNWAAWLRVQLDALGWTAEDLAARAGLDSSIVSRHLREGNQPKIGSVRSICAALHRDFRAGLVAAGHVTEKEMQVTAPSTADARTLSDEDLIEEVAMRLSGRRQG